MNKKGFTLIELLAVIIILGVLMIIAIPSVTKYIDDSRKNGYVSTAKNIASGLRNLINSGSLDLSDKDTTYYVDAECIKLDNGYKSPYGEFEKAYVVVAASYDKYDYFWTSVDSTGTGVKGLINIDKLESSNIDTDIKQTDITTDRGIDDRSKVVVVDSNCQKGPQVNRTGPKINSETGETVFMCKRATALHTKLCNRNDSNGCNATGQVGKGNTISYGALPTGAPKPGDAYDCDVNDDGTYDYIAERFYYLGSSGANSILIYYSNANHQTTYAYDSSGKNWYGPRDGYQPLPSTTTWKNPGIIAPGTRQILTENGGTSTAGGTIDSFTYEEKAARLITVQELVNACSTISTVGDVSVGKLDGCNWLMENIGQYEGSSGSYGYWLETPRSDKTNYGWYLSGSDRNVNNDTSVGNANRRGIRPVITINTSNIE